MIKDALSILRKENEAYLAYLFGCKLDEIDHLQKVQRRLKGAFFRSLLFFLFVLKNISLKKSDKAVIAARYFYYAGTRNQLQSLVPAMEGMEVGERNFILLVERGLLDKRNKSLNSEIVKFSLVDFLRSILLFLMKSPSLYFLLRRKRKFVALHLYFDILCKSYIYIPFFLRKLKSIKPQMVMVANDHNVENRSLIAVADYLGINTAYMQHASVSHIFPPLRFNFAFLDGEESFNKYLQCEAQVTITGSEKFPKIFLSGQKKWLERRENKEYVSEHIGIAINMLDKPEDIIGLVDHLLGCGLSVRLRWHPGQGTVGLVSLLHSLEKKDNVELSDPHIESVPEFFSGCQLLVAGNSSIHLEASISGLPSIYYEISKVNMSDYYGFIEAGLVPKVDELSELTVDKVAFVQAIFSERKRAVRRYSETFGTKWHGREGLLVARTLELILSGQSLSELYELNTGPYPFVEVFRLRE